MTEIRYLARRDEVDDTSAVGLYSSLERAIEGVDRLHAYYIAQLAVMFPGEESTLLLWKHDEAGTASAKGRVGIYAIHYQIEIFTTDEEF